MERLLGVLLMVPAACTFDAMTVGDATAPDLGEPPMATGPFDEEAAFSSSGSFASTSAVGEGTGDSATSEGASSADGASEQPASCPQTVFYWIDGAEVEPPMQLTSRATASATVISVAQSPIAEAGRAIFWVELDCPGRYEVLGLVWDNLPGAWPAPDADSFTVEMGDESFVWRYGCETFGESWSSPSWQPVRRLEAQPCDAQPWVLEVDEPTTFEIVLGNREEGQGSNVAGVSALVVTSDAAFDPYDVFTP